MAIPSLQSFILGENQTITLGVAHTQLRGYFRDNIWNDPLRIGGGFNSRRHMCFLEAGGENEWGRKFSVIENLDRHGNEGNDTLRFMGIAVGSMTTAIAIMAFVTGCITGQWAICGSIGGGFGAIGLLCLIPAIYSIYNHRREVQEISSENLDVQKVGDLVAQILIVLGNRNVVQELRNRVQHGQQN